MLTPAHHSAVFYAALAAAREPGKTPAQTAKECMGVAEALCRHFSEQYAISFDSLYGRIEFLSKRFSGFKKHLLHDVRTLAKQAAQHPEHISNAEAGYCVVATAHAIAQLAQTPLPAEFADLPLPSRPQRRRMAPQQPTALQRARFLRYEAKSHSLACVLEDDPDDTEIEVACAESEGQGLLPEQMQQLAAGLQEGDVLMLAESRTEGSLWRPAFVVVEPDYLFDITTVADFAGKHPVAVRALALVKKLKSRQATAPMLKGHMANYLLDRMVHSQGQNIRFADIQKELFQRFPLDITALFHENDTALKAFLSELEMHARIIGQVVGTQIKEQLGIDTADVVLEPAYFSTAIGIQGRLDLMERKLTPQGYAYTAIELKSGKAPDRAAWTNHRAQVGLYQMMLRYLGSHRNPRTEAYVLYSNTLQGNSLRHCPITRADEAGYIAVRNTLMQLEHQLLRLPVGQLLPSIAGWMEEALAHPQTRSYEREEIHACLSVLKNAPPALQSWLAHWVQFIAREHYLTKCGDAHKEAQHNQASLWRSSPQEKREAFELLDGMQLQVSLAHTEERTLTFRYDTLTDRHNFRTGDIVALYRNTGHNSILDDQVLKATVKEIGAGRLTLKLRHAQHNREMFRYTEGWAIEKDTLDQTVTDMYKSVFRLSALPDEAKRQRLLGLAAPRFAPDRHLAAHVAEGLSPEQQRIVAHATSAQDYYLLSGPPGTGKTSIMLRAMVEQLLADPAEQVLVIAYTNRAVDEVCDALGHLPFIRLGNGTGCAEKHRLRLLDTIAGECANRRQLAEAITGCRVYVGTLASMQANAQLLGFKSFTTAVIDEASQILEPQLMGLLCHVNRSIMIGDHKQLPAISLQGHALAQVEEAPLLEIGMADRRNSYFERLLGLCIKHGWHQAHGTLTAQGRMHEQIMALPNQLFYAGRLKTATPAQQAPLLRENPAPENNIYRLLCENRLLLVDSQHLPRGTNTKIREGEARAAAKLAAALYHINKDGFVPEQSVGIIAPYRNQGAAVRQYLEEENLPFAHRITVDTVERFQGSARDAIIVTLCANVELQMKFLAAHTENATAAIDGEMALDRKLNVMLTRARRQLVVIADLSIVQSNANYRKLMAHFHRHGQVLQAAEVLSAGIKSLSKNFKCLSDACRGK